MKISENDKSKPRGTLNVESETELITQKEKKNTK